MLDVMAGAGGSRSCAFCRRAHAANRRFRRARFGRHFAFDPARGRLWTVCGSCWRWDLWPVEERRAALEELERAVRDAGRMVARTANVALLHVGDVLLLRVGDPGLIEQSWWRYGRELRRRRGAAVGAASRIASGAWGVVAWVGRETGLLGPDEVSIDWEDEPRLDILRWRRFGWAAWHGRLTCAWCNSALRALRYDLSWWVYPLEASDGELELGVPCPRCDPWTPEQVYRLRGAEAVDVLRRCLAYQNVAGASEAEIRAAAGAVEAVGSAGGFVSGSARRGESLWRMRGTRALALEIALGETAERRLLERELAAAEFVWRREEALADVIDRELSWR